MKVRSRVIGSLTGDGVITNNNAQMDGCQAGAHPSQVVFVNVMCG